MSKAYNYTAVLVAAWVGGGVAGSGDMWRGGNCCCMVVVLVDVVG